MVSPISVRPPLRRIEALSADADSVLKASLLTATTQLAIRESELNAELRELRENSEAAAAAAKATADALLAETIANHNAVVTAKDEELAKVRRCLLLAIACLIPLISCAADPAI